jgi:hypothetical protein
VIVAPRMMAPQFVPVPPKLACLNTRRSSQLLGLPYQMPTPGTWGAESWKIWLPITAVTALR